MTLLSVGIPTFNRAEKLRRAAESVLRQTHASLELVISDNASSDATAALCAELCARDARVRYLRSETNRGPTANFNILYQAVCGEYAMVLSDDDWLEPDYLERCLEGLLADPRRSLVCGRARYLDGDRVVSLGVPFSLEDPDPRSRVLAYLRGVDENGLFYGLSRRETLRSAGPLRNVLGNDWLVVCGLLMAGTAATLETTAINREVGGTSADLPRLTKTLGLPRAQARLPHTVMAWQLFAEILWRGRPFRALRPSARARLAAAGALRVLDWRSDAWHLSAPTAAALGRRRGGRALWRAYLAITRRLGATHDRLPD
jgi:glycosyltransferase involved in cell wall biosynthesis